MAKARIALLCVPFALAGLGLAAHATMRVSQGERRLAELAVTGKAAGDSFVETLGRVDETSDEWRRLELRLGEQVERQRLAYDERRAVALSLASARRDRLLGLLGALAAILVAGGASVMRRIAEEVEEDRRHVAGQGRRDEP